MIVALATVAISSSASAAVYAVCVAARRVIAFHRLPSYAAERRRRDLDADKVETVDWT